jgi:hypothetical protein
MRLATVRIDGRTRAGHARDPQRFLAGRETVITEIEGLGRLENRITKEASW